MSAFTRSLSFPGYFSPLQNAGFVQPLYVFIQPWRQSFPPTESERDSGYAVGSTTSSCWAWRRPYFIPETIADMMRLRKRAGLSLRAPLDESFSIFIKIFESHRPLVMFIPQERMLGSKIYCRWPDLIRPWSDAKHKYLRMDIVRLCVFHPCFPFCW